MEVETKICDFSGDTMYKCKECRAWDYDVRDDTGECMVCYEMRVDPDQFGMTEKESKEMLECADYIQKHNISPNLDIPE